MNNKIGTFNFANYLKEFNNLPDIRHVDNQKFNGRITLKDSFEYYSDKTEHEQLNLISGIHDCAVNRTVGDYL